MHETRRGDGLEASSARVVLGLRKGSQAGVLGAGVGGPPSPWGTSWSPECQNVKRPAVHFRDRPTEFTCAHMHLHAAHPCTCADTVHTGTWTLYTLHTSTRRHIHTRFVPWVRTERCVRGASRWPAWGWPFGRRRRVPLGPSGRGTARTREGQLSAPGRDIGLRKLVMHRTFWRWGRVPGGRGRKEVLIFVFFGCLALLFG